MTPITICILPEGYRPTYPISISGTSKSSTEKACQMNIDLSGEVKLFGLGGNPKYWGFCVNYPIGF